MRTSAARVEHSAERVLFVVFELSSKSWKLGFATELRRRIRERNVSAWDLGAFESELKKAKERLGLEESAGVASCYEAGREGFTLERYLAASGISNAVVDAGSLEVKRRRRRAKTDRLDLGMLMNRLIRRHWGEKSVWSVVRVPSIEEEDQRQCHRVGGAVVGRVSSADGSARSPGAGVGPDGVRDGADSPATVA